MANTVTVTTLKDKNGLSLNYVNLNQFSHKYSKYYKCVYSILIKTVIL